MDCETKKLSISCQTFFRQEESYGRLFIMIPNRRTSINIKREW